MSSWYGLIFAAMIYLGIASVLITIAYYVIKAAVRNAMIEAHVRLRREGIYPPA